MHQSIVITRATESLKMVLAEQQIIPQSKNQLTTIATKHPFHCPFPGLTRSASIRKVKPIWILLKQVTVSCSGISWAICSRQITMPAQHHSVLYRPMLFLPHNQQCQCTEGKNQSSAIKEIFKICTVILPAATSGVTA